MNPYGLFEAGRRVREVTLKDSPALSAKLMPEFDKRQNIKEMFNRKPSLKPSSSTRVLDSIDQHDTDESIIPLAQTAEAAINDTPMSSQGTAMSSQLSTVSKYGDSSRQITSSDRKRAVPASNNSMSQKRIKSGAGTSSVNAAVKGQQSLKGFFKPKIDPQIAEDTASAAEDTNAFHLASASPAGR